MFQPAGRSGSCPERRGRGALVSQRSAPEPLPPLCRRPLLSIFPRPTEPRCGAVAAPGRPPRKDRGLGVPGDPRVGWISFTSPPSFPGWGFCRGRELKGMMQRPEAPLDLGAAAVNCARCCWRPREGTRC